ncbi:MAG: amidohydrolase family protein, partial [Acidimicrobiales bacterium]
MGVDTALRVIDADTHLTEPVDLWTARLPARFRDSGPRVRLHEPTGTWRWVVGDRWCSLVGNYSMAGWREFPPSCPPTLEEADPACYDAKARLVHMDANGIYAQVLYPNVIAFEGHAFMALKDEGLKLACVETYNDYQAEFASIAPDRFVALAVLPFWDLGASIAELRRCHRLGHRGALWAATLEKHGLPDFSDPHWDPLYAEAQDLGMSVNFHVGVGNTAEEIDQAMNRESYDPAANTARSSMSFISNVRTIGLLLTSGVCDRFPRLDFVSVESGFGYIPFLLDSLDWQWVNANARRRYPDRLLPSEYFRRQVYSMFWFETNSLELLPKYEDNVMFETDFPHPTSLHPGPASFAPSPAEVIRRDTEIVGEAVMRKVLQDNACRV